MAPAPLSVVCFRVRPRAGTESEAALEALNLRAGSLPASVEYLEERTVGPSLGADSIKAGLASGIAGVIAVAIPEGFFAEYLGNSWVSMLVMLLIGIPMYVCASASTPEAGR